MDTKKLRQKILDLAIHGKLVPQDPNDEPASVLLERIKAEKERLIKEGKIKRSKKTAKTSDTPHYENVPFEVPKGWVWTTLGNIGVWQSGGTPSRSNKSYYGGNIPWLKTGDLNDSLITNIPESITEEAVANSSAKINPTGSVLMAMYGATIGKLGILTFPATTNQACCACIEYYAITQYYLFYFLLSHRNIFIAKGGGGAQPNISKEIIVNTVIPLPPLSEQERIITEIERWFTLIDEIEQGKADLQTTIKQTKSKILDLAIHGKLVPQDPNDEPASELLKRINPKAEITCDNAQYGKRPFEIPNSWCWSRLGDINNIARGGSPRPIKDYLTDDKNGINWIKIGDTTREGKYIDAVKEKIRPEGMKKSRFVHKGDFLLTNSMSFGRPYILNVDGCIHDGWLVISPIGEVYTSDFMYHLLSSSFAFEQFTNVASGGVVTNLNSDKVADTIFPVPPLAEQQRIVAKIEKLFEQLDYIENSLEA